MQQSILLQENNIFKMFFLCVLHFNSHSSATYGYGLGYFVVIFTISSVNWVKNHNKEWDRLQIKFSSSDFSLNPHTLWIYPQTPKWGLSHNPIFFLPLNLSWISLDIVLWQQPGPLQMAFLWITFLVDRVTDCLLNNGQACLHPHNRAGHSMTKTLHFV